MPDDPADQRLAIEGGLPVRTSPLPTWADASGHRIGQEELDAVQRVVRSGRLNRNVGTEAVTLEHEFARYFGSQEAVASSSGTAALHLAVAAVDPEPGDEIITSPLTDGGTMLPIIAQNAVPIFADVDPRNGSLDVEAVRSRITDRTRAIILVHLFGVPGAAHELRRLADQHGIMLIEDCAQAYRTRCGPSGSWAGTIGHIGCFSLQQSKQITAGDGGLCITNDATLARRMRLFADKGWPRDTGERTHLFFSLNYRMTELQAAVARAQLPKLARIIDDRRGAARRLDETITRLEGLTAAQFDGEASYYLYPFFIAPDHRAPARFYADALVAEGIPALPGFLQHVLHTTPVVTERRTYGSSGFPLTAPPASTVPCYGRGGCPRAEDLVDRGLVALAWSENYTSADVSDIATALEKVHAAATITEKI